MASLKTVESFTGPIEAHIAKGRLEAEGIPAFVAHENHIWANWVFSNALGGVKVQVSESNYEAAQEILKQHIDGGFEETLNQEFSNLEVNACPSCGGTEYVSSVPLFSKIMLFLTFGLFSVIYKPRKENHKCAKCGCMWKY